MVKEFLSQHGVAFDVHNPDEKPLTKDRLWELMALPDGRLRTPLTAVGDKVILGYDPVKLEQVFGSQPTRP